MLIFYIIALVIQLAVFAGFMVRYRQTQVKSYLHLALATLANAVASAMMAFLGDMIFDSLMIMLVIIYAASIISSLAGLVMIMVVLGMLRTWVDSMRAGVKPMANKLDMAEKIFRYLRITYPVLTFVSLVFYVLLIVSLGFAGILALLVGLAMCLAMCVQCGIIVWMYLDMHGSNSVTESENRKKNQLLKLAGLTFFGAWPAMLAGVSAGIGGAVCWWLWYAIALWPGALVGFEEPIQASGVGGGADMKYANGGSAPQAFGQQGGYNAPAYGGASPQATYQPQHQQPYGGQPQGGYPQQPAVPQPYQGGQQGYRGTPYQ